jgi:hypothetical protein
LLFPISCLPDGLETILSSHPGGGHSYGVQSPAWRWRQR